MDLGGLNDSSFHLGLSQTVFGFAHPRWFSVSAAWQNLALAFSVAAEV
jgi:hypothetical protein